MFHFVALFLEFIHLAFGLGSHFISLLHGILAEFSRFHAGDGLDVFGCLFSRFLSNFRSAKGGVFCLVDLFIGDAGLFQGFDEFISKNACLFGKLVSQFFNSGMSLFRIHVIPVFLEFFGEIFLFVPQRLIFLRIVSQFFFCLLTFRLAFFKDGAVRFRIVRHTVLDPALGRFAQAVGDGNADRNLHDRKRNQGSQGGAYYGSAQRTDEGKDGLLVQFHAINGANFMNHVYFIGYKSYRSQKRSSHNDSCTACGPADEIFRFLVPVIYDIDFHICFRGIHMLVRLLFCRNFFSRNLYRRFGFFFFNRHSFLFFSRRNSLCLFYRRLGFCLYFGGCFRTNNRSLFHFIFFAHRNLLTRVIPDCKCQILYLVILYLKIIKYTISNYVK